MENDGLKERVTHFACDNKKNIIFDMLIPETFKVFFAKNYVPTLFYPPVIELRKPTFLNLITAKKKEFNLQKKQENTLNSFLKTLQTHRGPLNSMFCLFFVQLFEFVLENT